MNKLILGSVLLALAFGNPLWAQSRSSATVNQGAVAKWDAFDASECGIAGERYPAIEGVCYYPVHFTAEPGLHEIVVYTEQGEAQFGWLQVQNVDYPEINIELEDNSLINLEGEKLQQHLDNRQQLHDSGIFGIESSEPRFTLPLQSPAGDLPRSEDDFGSIRTFNQSDAQSQHSGRDYPVGAGSTVSSPADGTVLLSADHLLTGNAVYVDHGAGLVTMYFHLSERSVETGDEVSQGDKLGEIGSTGRSTGPHLHFGVRWMDQVIDPAYLLDDPSRYPTVGPDGGTPGTAGRDEPDEDGTGDTDTSAEGDSSGSSEADASGDEDNAGSDHKSSADADMNDCECDCDCCETGDAESA